MLTRSKNTTNLLESFHHLAKLRFCITVEQSFASFVRNMSNYRIHQEFIPGRWNFGATHVDTISILNFHVVRFLISQPAFAMTSAIVVLTRPSALPDTEPTHGELLFRMRSSSFLVPLAYLYRSPASRWPARTTHAFSYIQFPDWSLSC